MIQLPATQVPPMTQEQNELHFELTRRKLKAELAAAEVEARLGKKLMIREFESHVAAAVAAASAWAAAASAAAASTTTGANAPMLKAEENDITGEVPSEVTSITLRFASLLQEEIVGIFQNQFKPINFYHLRHIHRLLFDAVHEHNLIGIENGILRLRKMSGTYKDFGNSFYDVLADAFHNYTTIFVSLFSKKAPDLHITFAEFYKNVYELSTVYEWQEGVLSMSIEVHTYIVSQQPIDPSKWVMPEKFQDKFCRPRTMIEMSSTIGAGVAGGSKTRKSRSPAGHRCVKSSRSNNLSISCKLFNNGSCNWPYCNMANRCKKCGSRDNGL